MPKDMSTQSVTVEIKPQSFVIDTLPRKIVKQMPWKSNYSPAIAMQDGATALGLIPWGGIDPASYPCVVYRDRDGRPFLARAGEGYRDLPRLYLV